MSNGPSRLSFLLPLLLAACASTQHAGAPAAQPEVRDSAAEPVAAAKYPGAHAVLSVGSRAFVLTGAAKSAPDASTREILPGGFTLAVVARKSASLPRFTLLGPEGRCDAETTRAVELAVDYGGYAGASLPGPAHSGFELAGCEKLLHDHAFLIAIDGEDPSAEWLNPTHVEEVQAPADARLGENEVWLHRWALPKSELGIVERNVLTFVTASCSEQRRDVLVVDELDRPLARHAGYYLRGAIRTATGTSLVLMGHDEPEALRVVELGPADTRVTLDTRLELFQDVERAEC